MTQREVARKVEEAVIVDQDVDKAWEIVEASGLTTSIAELLFGWILGKLEQGVVD